MVVAARTARFKTWPELVACAKSKGGTATYATSGKGGSSHLLSVMLAREFGFDAQDVACKIASQAITDTASGVVDYFVANLPRGIFQALIGQMAEEVVWERFFKASGLQSARTNGFRGVVRLKTAERENAA